LSTRIHFLLRIGDAALNLSLWKIFVLIAGYAICEGVDRFILRRRFIKAVDYGIDGWEPEQGDPKWESKGNLSRIELTGENQILFVRVADLVRSVIFATTK